MSRVINISLKNDLSRFLDQEVARIREVCGIKVSYGDIIRVLLEQHRQRVFRTADEDRSALWYYQRLREQEIDIASAAASTANAADSPPRRQLGRRPKKW